MLCMHICAYTPCICIYACVCMCMRIRACTLCICIYICAYMCKYYISHTIRTTATWEQGWCTGQASSRQAYLQSTAWVERLLQDVTFLWHLVRGNCVWGSFPHPQFPLSYPSSATSLYFGHKYFAKITKLPSGGRALYTYQPPFNHQTKGVTAASAHDTREWRNY